MNYGVTEVFIKHWYFSNLRIKLVKRENDRLILCQYLGDHVVEIKDIETTDKVYPIPERFFLIDLPSEYGYIYQSGDYSFYRYKYILHRGSSRSSKSWSLEEAAIRISEQNPSHRLTIWRDTRTSLGETIWKDFRKVFPMSGRKYNFPQDTRPIFLANGSTIEPHGDDTTNAHGLTQDIAWANEPYKMSKETFDQIDQRSNQIWIDINPKQGHWSDKLADNPRCKVIHSTFENNPFCPIEQRLKILSYDPSNPINVINQTADEYMWQVYGLGLKAEKPNRIYRNWGKITPLEYDALPYREYYYNDWGKNDPWAIGRAKYHDGCVYIREVNYKSENEWEKDIPVELQREFRESDVQDESNERNEGLAIVSWLYKRLGISKDATIVCDPAKPLKIATLRRSGWINSEGAIKGAGSVDTGIDLVKSVKVFFTTDSPNIENEYENYSYIVDRYNHVTDLPEDKDNHHMDGIRYLCSFLVRIGVLRLS